MSTGDIRNNLKKLQKQVTFIRYPDELDYEGLTSGDVSAHLPILYHAFFDFSPKVVENVAKLNYSLSGKKDTAFLSIIFKIMREHNSKCNLGLKIGQFMTNKGFAERKIILTKDIIEFVRTSPKLVATVGKTQKNKSLVNVNALLGVMSASDPGDNSPDISAITVIRDSQRSTMKMSRVLSSAPDIKSTSRGDRNHPNHDMQSTSRSALSHPTRMLSIAQNDEGERNPVYNESLMDNLHSTVRDTGMVHSVVRHVRDIEDTNTSQEGDTDSVFQLELKSQIERLTERQTTLETENRQLKVEIKDVNIENVRLREEVETIVSQQQRIDLGNIVARLDIMEAKFLTLETRQIENLESHSPVCGDNLCGHMQKLQLHHNDSFSNSSQAENSLLDVTNESPSLQHRQKGLKLLELVQGTRSLLGLSDLSGFQQSEDKEDENIPPVTRPEQ